MRSFAAPGLHPADAVQARRAPTLLLAPVAIAALWLAAAGQARAQATPTAGKCTGGLAGDVGLAVLSSGTFQSISATYAPNVFGKAECQCQTTDIALQIKLTQALPSTPQGELSVWVGTGCDSYTVRNTTNQTQCERISTSLKFQDFTTGASTSTSSFINIPIPADKLFSPNATSLMCDRATATNSIYVVITTTDQTTNAALCTFTPTEVGQGPTAATGVTAASGDSAVTVNWLPPPTGSVQPDSFQVLCATADGQPVPGRATVDQVYSVCIDGQIHRRALPTASSTSVTTTVDGGTSTTTDLGTASTPLEPLAWTAPPLGPSQAAADAGVTDAAVMVTNSDFAKTLDPAFVCSPQLNVSGTSYAQRIAGLTNGVPYQFVVLSIDKYGNATPSDVVIASPIPAEDLYSRYRASGGTASGFCFVATAAYGSYEHGAVRLLRDFRDGWLLPHAAGRAFVDWYYAHSPPWAGFIAAHPVARRAAQVLLWPAIALAAFLVYLSPWQKALVITLALGAWLLRRERARLRKEAA